MAVVRTPAERMRDRLAIAAVIAITIIMLAPIYWIASTAFKPRSLATTVPPTVFFKPEITPFIKLFTKRVQLLRPVDKATYDAAPWWERLVYDGGERVLKVGGDPQLSAYPNRFLNSLIIAISSTFLAVAMGTITAYGFSRFRITGEPDLLFFILSTRMLPPVVVAIPMFLMYRQVGLVDTHIGLIILYTAFNLSFSVWLMKGFIDEIPKEYEEAALVDGYTRLQAFLKIVIPESATGNCGDGGVLLYHRLERVCLRADDDQSERADRSSVHPGAARLRLDRLDDNRGRKRAVSASRRAVYFLTAQPSAARRHVRCDPQVTIWRLKSMRGEYRRFIGKYIVPLAMLLMILGFVCLCQPWSEFLHVYSVAITLLGLILFTIFARLAPQPGKN